LSALSKKDQTFLNIALELGKLSTCNRAQIGAVVVREGRCVCWGYNGAPPGLPHCADNHHGWDSYVVQELRDAGRKSWHVSQVNVRAEMYLFAQGCRNATHAEANAISFAARAGISTEGGTLYVSQSPCLDCSRLTIAAGIVRVVYDTIYRDHSGIELLKTAGVEIQSRKR
jgi:dCMP deaminase